LKTTVLIVTDLKLRFDTLFNIKFICYK